MSDPTSDPSSADSEALSPQVTVGIIVGISGIATLLIMSVLYALMVCKYCLYRHSNRGQDIHGGRRRSRGTGLGSTSGSFTRGLSPQNSYSMPQYNQKPSSRPTSGYHVSTFDSGRYTLESTDGRRTQSLNRNHSDDDVQRQKRRTYIGSRQFPSKNLVLLTLLADGEFGPVYRGEAYDITPREASRIVTVKMLKESADDSKRVKFEQEITFLSHLNHLNVVGVLGVITDATTDCIILDGGTSHVDLLSYVRDKGVAMRGVEEGDTIVQEFRDLLKMADEACLGLSYLASQHIVHKDVALRNCIRGQNGVIKISSFGTGPKMYPEAYHFLHGRNLPVRWMAPESLNSDVYATASDVWSFGVLVWELFTYGELPFPTLSNDQVVRKVAQHLSLLPQPDKCPEDVFLVMSSSWARDPTSRPSFTQLHQHLFDLTIPPISTDGHTY